MEKNQDRKRKYRDRILHGLVDFAAVLSVSMLILIIGFIFVKGMPMVNGDFLTGEYNARTSYIDIPAAENAENRQLNEKSAYIGKIGVTIEAVPDEKGEMQYQVTAVDKDASALDGADPKGNALSLKAGDIITKIGTRSASKMSDIEDAIAAFDKTEGTVRIRTVIPGGGIYPMLVTTLLMILLSLVIAIPIGVCAAIYLTEYAHGGRLIDLIRFATESLSGIPSIVFGLFGMLFFVKFLNIGQSILSGSLTLSILLLPTIIRTTEETLKTIPPSYKEGSFGLGATKLQTLRHIVLPGAIPGILVAVILSVGRIVGESAALLFTAGTFASVPGSLLDSGATLTVRAYVEVKEFGNVTMASAIGVVLIVIVLLLNISSRVISAKLMKNRNAGA